MNGNTRGRDGRLRRSPPWRAGALTAALAGIALLGTACGNGGTSTSSPAAGGSKAYQQALAYAHCMHSHGVANFPDPTSNGDIVVKRKLGSPRQFALADKTCKHLLGGQVTAAQRQKAVTAALKFAACMRTHGIANFPDPDVQNAPGSIGFTTTGIDTNSPGFLAAQKACEPLMRGGGS
jgi:hypothetical protein